MNFFISLSVIFFTFISETKAAAPGWFLLNAGNSNGFIVDNNLTFIQILTLIQWFLLKALLPVVLIGASIYIAYELFTAEGDEAKMKKAWKSVAYSAIWLIAIALSYAFVWMISRLSF